MTTWKGALAGGEKALLKLVMTTHAGMTTDEFQKTVADWLATARHPKTGRPYTEMVYQTPAPYPRRGGPGR